MEPHPAKIAAMANTALHRGLNTRDATKLRDLWKETPAPRSVITSPPYLDMHDYGHPAQIGVRGQVIEDYLERMRNLFCDCYHIATADATFWLVAGSVRRNKRLIPLPDWLTNCAVESGWILRESITWDKQKALPWTHHGELRDITEQVLLFSKSDDFQFDAAGLRSPIPNSVWWRRYPERYSPDGSMPTNLWSIQIPTQGAWSGVRSHFCPFPEELTYRMLSLTTVPGDVVLDPLAGIGSVPAMAEAMGRVGYGVELVERYNKHYEHTVKSAETFIFNMGSDVVLRANFRKTIIELRLLKFARLLARQLTQVSLGVRWVKVEKRSCAPQQDHHVTSAAFDLVIDEECDQLSALAVACSAATRAPLSKFGIEAQISVTVLDEAPADGYWYSSGRFWDAPSTDRPAGGEPHVVARFKPELDLVDDIPYI